MADPFLLSMMSALDKLTRELAPFARAARAAEVARLMAADAARVEALRVKVGDTAELMEALREELAEAATAEKPALVREYNAASAKLVSLNAEIATLANRRWR